MLFIAIERFKHGDAALAVECCPRASVSLRVFPEALPTNRSAHGFANGKRQDARRHLPSLVRNLISPHSQRTTSRSSTRGWVIPVRLSVFPEALPMNRSAHRF